MQIGMKHRSNIKFKLPIQDMQAKAGHTVSHDFEPIIIEEVFYNVKASTTNEMLYDPRIAKNMLTP